MSTSNKQNPAVYGGSIIRPSALPMQALCPKFDGQGGEFAEAGIKRHAALSAYLGGDDKAFEHFDDEEIAGMQWAADYIRLKAPMQDYPLVFETPRTLTTPTGLTMTGTPDVTCGSHLFDLKWRWRNYTPQMGAYALMLLHDAGLTTVTAHILYAQNQKVVTLTFDADTAWATFQDILAEVTLPTAQAKPCEYCGWCRHRFECPALLDRLAAVQTGRPDWALEQYHSSQISDPVEMGRALRLARCLSNWCEAVEYHAKEMAFKQGAMPQGFKIRERQGNAYIDSVSNAYAVTNLPQKTFLDTCKCIPAELFKTYAEFHGLPVAAAKREVTQRLGEHLLRKPASSWLAEDKDKP